MTARATTLAAALLLFGCANPVWMPHAPLPIEGARAELAGVWRGTYESRDTGRFGDIVFALPAEGDAAAGEVVMVPRGRSVTVLREGDRWRWDGATRPDVLTVRFVRIAADSLRGELDPYLDPDCGCEVRTVFEGRIEGDQITGPFESLMASGYEARGTWSVTRRSR